MLELIIILILLITILILGFIVFNIKIKKIKEVGHDEKLDKLALKFPDNIDICKDVLEMLNNTNTKIKEENEEGKKDSLYVAVSDTIFIGNIKDTYTRIQTVCHECLHSIQPRRLLMFNFIYSNIYIIYYIISIVLTLTNVFKNMYLQIVILSLMGFMQYVIRAYLENDAMIKAKYLAKDYMEKYIKKNPICKEKDIEEITNKYDEINKLGIPAYNYMLLFQVLRKVILFVIIAIIKTRL